MRAARFLATITIAVIAAGTVLPVDAAQRRGRAVNGRGYRGPDRGAAPVHRPPVYRAPIYGAPFYRPPFFAQPYYRFRPRVTVGSGLMLGFAVPYPGFAAGAFYVDPFASLPYAARPYLAAPYGGYPVPYPVLYQVPSQSPYQSPYQRPYPPAGWGAGYPPLPSPPITVTPGAGAAVGAYGGISLEVTPEDAEIWIDGALAGRAGDFGPQHQPLPLGAGVHRIELRAPGFVTSLFDVTITPGYVLPYQGGLQPEP